MSLNAELSPPANMPLWSGLSEQFAGAATRLCLFSVPLDLLPFYRERVFPIAEEIGFVPVTGSDVISLGDSIAGKIDTLIDRSAVMIVDAVTPYTRNEQAYAEQRIREGERPNRQALQIITVLSGGLDLSKYSFHRVVRRPADLTDQGADEFVDALRRELEIVAQQVGIALSSEPRRLFDSKEYRAAVISAMTLLETELRKRLDKKPWEKVTRPMAFRQLLTKADDQDIAPLSRDELLSWSKLRNEVVHSAKQVNKGEARPVVEGVERVLGLA